MAKKNKKGSRAKTEEEKEFDLPQGLDLLEKNGWGHKFAQWLKSNFSAIILPIIALIILGGGIYLYSQQKNSGLKINQNDIQSGTLINLDNQNASTTVSQKQAQTQKPSEQKKEQKIAASQKTNQTKTETQKSPVQGQTEIKTVYQETAQKGDGITHLARRAIKEYLQTSQLKMSPEQKVYMEDYLQNHTGNRMLALGEKISFSKTLIQSAISHAQKLTQSQLHNLEKYSHLVPSLNY